MKKLICLFSLLFVLMMTGCINGADIAKSELKSSVEASNKDCPLQVADGVAMQSITYDEPNVIIVYSIDEGKYDLDTFKANALKGLTDSSNPAVSDLAESLRRSGASLIIKGVTGTEQFEEKVDF